MVKGFLYCRGGIVMLRSVIIITDCEKSVEKAKKEILRTRSKGHGIALDYTRIKDKVRKRELLKLFMTF
jgi:hypothetical protein